jgi:hypothetical protein
MGRDRGEAAPGRRWPREFTRSPSGWRPQLPGGSRSIPRSQARRRPPQVTARRATAEDEDLLVCQRHDGADRRALEAEGAGKSRGGRRGRRRKSGRGRGSLARNRDPALTERRRRPAAGRSPEKAGWRCPCPTWLVVGLSIPALSYHATTSAGSWSNARQRAGASPRHTGAAARTCLETRLGDPPGVGCSVGDPGRT